MEQRTKDVLLISLLIMVGGIAVSYHIHQKGEIMPIVGDIANLESFPSNYGWWDLDEGDLFIELQQFGFNAEYNKAENKYAIFPPWEDVSSSQIGENEYVKYVTFRDGTIMTFVFYKGELWISK